LSSLQMILAGVAWGIYSLHGRRNADPVTTTAGNFLRAATAYQTHSQALT